MSDMLAIKKSTSHKYACRENLYLTKNNHKLLEWELLWMGLGFLEENINTNTFLAL